MLRLRILPYKPGSAGAKFIARALNGLRVRFNGAFRPFPRRHLVVNWGTTRTPAWWGRLGTRSLNNPNNVNASSNKAEAFRILAAAGVSIPEFTTSYDQAIQWTRNERPPVIVARTVLNGHAGIGCHIWTNEMNIDMIPRCNLYTKHLRHKREFRIHVFNGQIIAQVEKLRKRGFENRQPWIRNHANGWVFCAEGITVPEIVRQEAVKATAALGLDFGAVDVAYREKENCAYIFEVNTAPGLEGRTIVAYTNAIRSLLK